MNYSRNSAKVGNPFPSQELLKWNISYSDPTPSKGNVESVVCMHLQISRPLAQQRNEYYQRQSEAMRSVDNTLMQDSDPRMPISSLNGTHGSFGKGS